MINWLKAVCPVCQQTFEYAEGGYKPKTCNKFECLHKFIHHPEKYKSFNDHLDQCRTKAGI